MNYYNRYWDETTGEDLTDSWGTSTFYVEADADNIVSRQVQVFQNGKGLKYWSELREDDYGMISDQPLDSANFEQYKIHKTEFEKAWKKDYKR